MSNSTIPENLVPADAFSFSYWCRQPPLFSFENPFGPIEGGKVTLAVGDNMPSLMIHWLVQRRKFFPPNPPLYIKGGAPEESDFFGLLRNRAGQDRDVLRGWLFEYMKLGNQPSPRRPQEEKDSWIYGYPACFYPIGDEPVAFLWTIVNKNIGPWSYGPLKRSGSSWFENVLRGEKLNPPMIVFDGFPWPKRQGDWKMLLEHLKEKSVSVVLISPTMPSGHIRSSSIWDNILEVQPWRSQRCGKYNVVLRCHRLMDAESNRRLHLIASDGIEWMEKGDYYFLKDYVENFMNFYTNAQLVEIINQRQDFLCKLKRPMTIPTLARLKREWGLRTYRPEKHPRKKKVARKKEAPQTRLQKPPQAVPPFPFDF